jgi:dTDP-glucose 4,6-dehydratase
VANKVIVTGSAGFVGSHLVEHILKNTDWNVVGLDSFKHRGDSLRVYGDPKRYEMFACDLSTPISSRLAEQIGHIDYFINVASDSHVDRSITNPVPFVENNVSLMLNTLEYARRSIPKAFLQISTDEVYGAAPEGVDHEEWSPIIPSNPYSASKAAQEAIAISYWRTYSVPLVLTNTMNMFGERQDPEKYLPLLISKVSRGETVKIHGTPSYIGKRKYLHTRNLADALLFLLKSKTPTKYVDNVNMFPDRYNVVGDIELDNLELAQMVAEIIGKPLKYELIDFHSARPGHDRRYSLDGTKLQKLGWKAPVAFKASLKKTITWTLKNQIWLEEVKA